MKAFLIFPGVIAIVIGAILIFAPAAPTLQVLLGAILLMLGPVITYIAVFSEE